MEQPTLAMPALLIVVWPVRCGLSTLLMNTATMVLGNITTVEALMVMLSGATPRILGRNGNIVMYLFA